MGDDNLHNEHATLGHIRHYSFRNISGNGLGFREEVWFRVLMRVRV